MEKAIEKTGNVVIDTLNETVQKLRQELRTKRVAVLEQSKAAFTEILISISPALDGCVVEVSDYGFSIRRYVDQWWKDIIDFKMQYTYDRSPESTNRWKKLYNSPATLSWSSCHATEPWELDRGIIIGTICAHFKQQSPQYLALIEQFKKHHDLMDNIEGEDELTNAISECEKQIKRIQDDEVTAQVNAIFNRGEHEHTESISWKYGASRWKRASAKKWYWELKKKNFIFGYIGVGNIKTMVKDNMTKEDLVAFIKYNFLKKA